MVDEISKEKIKEIGINWDKGQDNILSFIL